MRSARARAAGRAVLAETRPIYLYLTQERFLEPQGEKYVGYPPLRERADVDAIWEALADGTVDVVATDHCSWQLSRKNVAGSLHANSARHVEPGDAGADALFRGRREAADSLERMVELVASNPAKIFGLYPRKGAIIEGADADLVVFDPNAKVVVRASRDALARGLRSVRRIRGHRMARGPLFRAESRSS